VYDTTSVDAAVASLNAVVQDAMEQVIPRAIIKSKSKFPHWYSGSLRYYSRKKNYTYFYRRFKKRKLTLFFKTFLSTVS
jgi:hypothetical protein